MQCPNPDCGDAITGVHLMITVSGVIYAPDENERPVDVCSYPELETQAADPDTEAECMECEHKAKLRAFFPGDFNA